jgi:hypothetical protein
MLLKALKDSAVLYYLFHLLYAGHPADILGKFWIAHDIEDAQQGKNQRHGHGSSSPSPADEPTSSWKTLEDGLKESWRATGVMVSLLGSDLHHTLPAHDPTYRQP